MEPFVMSIAGTAARIQGCFQSTRDYFSAYLTDGAPQVELAVTAVHRQAEQRLLDEEADREGLRRRVFTDPFLERASVARQYAAALAGREVLLLHGSTVAAYGKGYLFTAKTGVGKSTHTRFWREMLGSEAVMVNDDRTFLRLTDEPVTAWGSPWSGKHGLDTNIRVPLAGICILKRGNENRIRSVEPEEAMPLLLEQSFVPEPGQEERVYAMTRALACRVPLWKLECTKQPEAARVAFAAMRR